MGRGLADIEDRLAIQMMRPDLVSHHAALPSRREPREAGARAAAAPSSSSRSLGRPSTDGATPVLGCEGGTDPAEGLRVWVFRDVGADGASVALRFWRRGSLPTPETGTFNNGGRAEMPAASRSRARSAANAVPLVCGDGAIRIGTQAASSNIQAGSSSQRPVTRPSRLQRKVLVPRRSTASCTCTVSPNHGCHGYRTRRSSVTWAFCCRLLQFGEAALLARLPDTRGLCRDARRNRRPAAQPRPAPPLACCSHRAARRINRRGSNRHWTKHQWQVNYSKARGWHRFGDYRPLPASLQRISCNSAPSISWSQRESRPKGPTLRTR